MTEEQKSITPQPEEGTIDVPHNPDAEAALIQECRERLSMLEGHSADPGTVALMQSINNDLEKIMVAVANTDEYSCNCTEVHECFQENNGN